MRGDHAACQGRELTGNAPAQLSEPHSEQGGQRRLQGEHQMDRIASLGSLEQGSERVDRSEQRREQTDPARDDEICSERGRYLKIAEERQTETQADDNLQRAGFQQLSEAEPKQCPDAGRVVTRKRGRKERR